MNGIVCETVMGRRGSGLGSGAKGNFSMGQRLRPHMTPEEWALLDALESEILVIDTRRQALSLDRQRLLRRVAQRVARGGGC